MMIPTCWKLLTWKARRRSISRYQIKEYARRQVWYVYPRGKWIDNLNLNCELSNLTFNAFSLRNDVYMICMIDRGSRRTPATYPESLIGRAKGLYDYQLRTEHGQGNLCQRFNNYWVLLTGIRWMMQPRRSPHKAISFYPFSLHSPAVCRSRAFSASLHVVSVLPDLLNCRRDTATAQVDILIAWLITISYADAVVV